MCLEKKEMKLKYELENNVNLVSFSNMNIEISFNDKLNKSFVKDLSEKLYDWTKNRWLISFSKEITIDIFFVTDAVESRVMEFGDILTYRQTSGTATWNDSEGDYLRNSFATA